MVHILLITELMMVVQFGSLLNRSTVVQPELVFLVAIVLLEEEQTFQAVVHYLQTFISHVVINCSITCYDVVISI